MIIWLALAPPLLLVLIMHYPLLDLSQYLLFFHVEDKGILVEYAYSFFILVEYAYSFLRLIFNTAQLGFYHCTL